MRPINALVDVTNYISLDRGRPLHVYDADKLKGAIRARLGRKGEKFLGLDGKSYDVDADMCVIADDRAVLGFGGMLGGEDTGGTDATTNVLIECAYFDPLRTARTGRKARHCSPTRATASSAASIPISSCRGSILPPSMMLELCGGTPCKVKIAGKPPKTNKPFNFDLGLVERLSGLELEQRQIRDCSRRSASRSTARASTSRRRRRPGGPTSPARPISSRRSCASPASTRCRRRRCRARPAWPSRC